MKTIKIWSDSPSDKQLDEICERLSEGEIMIWPTDTLYGIACDALNSKAIERVCRLKGLNPDKTHLSIICADIAQASEYAKFDNTVFKLLKHITPGPFTVICKAASRLPKAFKGRKMVGIRIPDRNICRVIAERLNSPVLTTSIKFDEDDYALSPELIEEEYDGVVDFMIDGGEGGIERSTVLDCSAGEITVIREGLGKVEL